MAKTSEAKAKVSLDSASFEKGAKAVADAASSMSKKVSAAFATAGAAILAFAGIKSVGGIARSMNNVLELGESLANAGHKAYFAAGQMYLFNNAVEKGLNFKTTAELIGENAEVLNRSANTFRDVSIKLWVVGEKIQGFWLGLMDRLAPVLSKLLDGALAQNLVRAGQMFGDALSNAVKVVYQVTQDGTLWDTFKAGFKIAFDYIVERLVWLASVGGAMLAEVISDGLLKGVLNGFKKLLDGIFELLGRAVIGLADLLKTAFFGVDDLSAFDAEDITRKQANRMEKGDDPNTKSGFLKILNEHQFKQSGDLAKDIAGFSLVIKASLDKFNKGAGADPAKAFENNTRRAAIGADSLAAIGAGGNVYMGLSVLDVQRQQLDQLRQINGKLDQRNPDALKNAGKVMNFIGISRAQAVGGG